jgi:hypothetical protein
VVVGISNFFSNMSHSIDSQSNANIKTLTAYYKMKANDGGGVTEQQEDETEGKLSSLNFN